MEIIEELMEAGEMEDNRRITFVEVQYKARKKKQNQSWGQRQVTGLHLDDAPEEETKA